MAYIDKTYTDSYKDYKEFKDWANKQTLTFFDGYSVNIGERVWEYEEVDFLGGEIPIMNTPTWFDIYLIQNCKSEFVLNRMKEVYGESTFKEYKKIDLTALPPENYQQNRKVVIRRNKNTKFPLHKIPYNGGVWWLQCKDYFWYNEKADKWVSEDFYYPHNSNTALIKSTKSLIRHLRKQYLPKGVKFTLFGRYIGEEYDVIIN